MHRTLSIDYGVVIEGEMELVLDSGENRAMKRGDVAVQRCLYSLRLYIILASSFGRLKSSRNTTADKRRTRTQNFFFYLHTPINKARDPSPRPIASTHVVLDEGYTFPIAPSLTTES
ncbi:hypothetical protein FVER53590_25055 [Fusarium verticillioides]|nr:hypothetical protein FVER53590_25055 [Fusarium verticillioides]